MKDFEFTTLIKNDVKLNISEWLYILRKELPLLFSEAKVQTYDDWIEFYESNITEDTMQLYASESNDLCFAFSIGKKHKNYLLTVTLSENYNYISNFNSPNTIDIKTTNIVESRDIILYNIYLMVEHLSKQ